MGCLVIESNMLLGLGTRDIVSFRLRWFSVPSQQLFFRFLKLVHIMENLNSGVEKGMRHKILMDILSISSLLHDVKCWQMNSLLNNEIK